MINSDSKGQISVEWVLLVGLMVVIVLAVAQFIGPNLEQDEVMSAARIACIDASNDIAYVTGNVIKFNNMTFNNGTITVTVYSKKALSLNNATYIQNEMLNNIAEALNTNIVDNTVQGRYTYKITVNNIT